MFSRKHFRIAGLTLGVALALTACSSDENADTMMTDADGKALKVENEGAPKTLTSSEDAYKATQGNDPSKTKGYPKR